jgi:hypothetical protein
MTDKEVGITGPTNSTMTLKRYRPRGDFEGVCIGDQIRRQVCKECPRFVTKNPSSRERCEGVNWVGPGTGILYESIGFKIKYFAEVSCPLPDKTVKIPEELLTKIN